MPGVISEECLMEDQLAGHIKQVNLTLGASAMGRLRSFDSWAPSTSFTRSCGGNLHQFL